MVSTGRKKLLKLASSIAPVAVPLNHLSPTAEEAKTAIRITPETYSGVAVVTMAKVESDRSVREPSRIPASTPRSSAEGTISIITQNISLAVRPKRVAIISPTSVLKTVDVPQWPCRMPQKRGASAMTSGVTVPLTQRPRSPASTSSVQPGNTPSHCAYFTGIGCR